MDLQNTIERLIDALAKQHISFNENLTNYDLSQGLAYGLDSNNIVLRGLAHLGQSLTSYDNINMSKFNDDLKRVQDIVGDQMLIGWKYASTSIIVVGAIHVDEMADSEIKNHFNLLEKTAVQIFHKHVGDGYSGSKGSVYCTFIPVISDTNIISKFKDNIKQYFKSHFWKQVYTSTMCVDCINEELIMGRALVGEWKIPGLDRKQLYSDVFGNK